MNHLVSIIARSSASPSATSSRVAFSTATAAGCGTSGKGCGTGVSSITRSGNFAAG